MSAIRRTCLLLVCSALLTGTMASAQDTGTGAVDDPALVEARALLQAGREDIIRDEIRFTESEAAEFWPAYRKYKSDLAKVRDRQAELVAGYLQAYRAGAVTESLADSLIDDYLEIKSDLLKVQRRHLKNFRRALPARKAGRFYQLENKLNAELDAQLARFVPLMDPV